MTPFVIALLAAPVAAQELSIPYELYELDNGLDVILAPDDDLPIVQVNVWYHVGSKDEVPGRSGFAHLFEHLMFQGSEHSDQDYFAPLQEVGGRINGTTTSDRTNYYEGVPSHYLPLALWMEADRMGWLLPALTEEKLANQKEVVRNERRQRYENRPYGTAWLTISDNMWPEGHPYRHPTIGLHEDLEAATLEDVTTFFETWYVPNNASLVVCGDFDADATKALIAEYFGEIPRGEDPAPAAADPVRLTEASEVRQTEAGAPHAKFWMSWHSPIVLEPGDAELDVLASILTSGKDSRLYRELVLERQIARDIGAYQGSRTLGSTFTITGTAAEGHTTDELVAAVDEILAELVAAPPSQAEVDVAVTNWEATFIRRLRSVANKANTLNSYNYHTGEPDWLEQDLDRFRQVTPEGVQGVVQEYLGADARFILHIAPGEDAPAGEGE